MGRDTNDVILENVLEMNQKLGTVSEQLTDVSETLETHGDRLTALEGQSGLGLTKAQKTALWAGVSGLAIEGLRHIKTLLFGLLWIVKGVPKL
jgi:hypothetical protein